MEEILTKVIYDKYIVNSLGEVYCFRKGKPTILNQHNGTKGHKQVTIRMNGKSTGVWVHKLVAEAFLIKKDDNHIVTHLDGDPTNNKLSNLAYRSYRDNAWDRVDHGTMTYGEKANSSKLKEHQVKEILASRDRHVNLARKYGVSTTAIQKIRRGDTWFYLSGKRPLDLRGGSRGEEKEG